MLVAAPFADWRRPSIQLGLLSAVARRAGHRVETRHLTLDLVPLIGIEDYDELAGHRGRMTGDWLFSVEAFGAQAPDPDGDLFFRLAPELHGRRDRLLEIRQDVLPRFLDAVTTPEDWLGVDVVAFTSTFQQTTASLAIARRVRAIAPHVVVVFGGANLDGDMGAELVRTLPDIDIGISGEADEAFPALLSALDAGTDPSAVPGVIRRVGTRIATSPPAPPTVDLDALPDPSYDEYFARGRATGMVDGPSQRGTRLPFESARGCWWGAKHHCTFCGLNGSTMTFRSKSPDRVLAELGRLARRYGTFRFSAVDNIIDPTYLNTLLPALRDAEAGVDVFYEVKANLTREQLRLFAQAGVRQLQPGLESLSTSVLASMRKGVRMIQNVNTLRWALYSGVQLHWNLLFGFPGETDEDYAGQTQLMPALRHLQPPGHVGSVWLERFSPLYADAVARGDPPPPEASYRTVYPAEVCLDRIAYFFEPDEKARPEVAATTYDDYERAVHGWQDAWGGSGDIPSLTVRAMAGHAQVDDRRGVGADGTHLLHGAMAEVHAACMDRPITAAAVAERTSLAPGRVDRIVDDLVDRRLFVRDGTRVLALALPAVPGR